MSLASEKFWLIVGVLAVIAAGAFAIKSLREYDPPTVASAANAQTETTFERFDRIYNGHFDMGTYSRSEVLAVGRDVALEVNRDISRDAKVAGVSQLEEVIGSFEGLNFVGQDRENFDLIKRTHFTRNQQLEVELAVCKVTLSKKSDQNGKLNVDRQVAC